PDVAVAVVAVVRQVLVVAVLLVLPDGDAPEQRIAERRIHDQSRILAIVAAGAEHHFAARVPGGTTCYHVDGARSRVLAEQRALRTAQDFDTFDVEGRHHVHDTRAYVDAVDVLADRRI